MLIILVLFWVFFFTSQRSALSAAGVGERPSLGRLPVADGHVFRSVRPGAAAGVSRQTAAVSPQLHRGPARPARSESRRWLLRGRQATDARLWPVAVVHSWSALPSSETEVPMCCILVALSAVFYSSLTQLSVSSGERRWVTAWVWSRWLQICWTFVWINLWSCAAVTGRLISWLWSRWWLWYLIKSSQVSKMSLCRMRLIKREELLW